MRDNNNAGVHYIKHSPNYENTRYYDRKAEELYKKKQQAKLDFENEQRLTYELEIEDIDRCGNDMIEIFYSNLAYEVFNSEVYLIKAINDVESFIEKHGEPDEQPEKALFRMGILQDLLDIPMEKLFVDNRKQIEKFFIDYVLEAVNNGEYEVERFTITDENSEKYVSIETPDISTTSLYLIKDKEEYMIHIKFGLSDSDLAKPKKRGKNGIWSLYHHLVRSRSVHLSYAYTKALHDKEARGLPDDLKDYLL